MVCLLLGCCFFIVFLLLFDLLLFFVCLFDFLFDFFLGGRRFHISFLNFKNMDFVIVVLPIVLFFSVLS